MCLCDTDAPEGNKHLFVLHFDSARALGHVISVNQNPSSNFIHSIFISHIGDLSHSVYMYLHQIVQDRPKSLVVIKNFIIL